MGKPPKSAASRDISAKEIRRLYKAGKDTNDFGKWNDVCIQHCQLRDSHVLTYDRISTFLRELCTDLDPTRCEEFGRTAALLHGKGEFNHLNMFTEEIKSQYSRRRREIIVNHYTEEDDEGDDSCLVLLCEAFIPYASSADLKSIAELSPGLSAMERWLTKDPNRHESLQTIALCFHDLDSDLAMSLDNNQKKLVKTSNYQLWFQHELWKRIAVGFQKKKEWDVVDVRDALGDLLREIQKQRMGIDGDFLQKLRDSKKLVKLTGPPGDSDDETTLAG